MATACCSFLQLPTSSSSSYSSSRFFNLPLPSLKVSSSPVRSPFSFQIFANLESKLPSFNSNADSSLDPSLRHANILFFKSVYNVQIVVDDGEPEEVLLRRFRREVSKAGVIQECKRRRFFENKQEEKKRKVKEAGRRNRGRRQGPRLPSSPTDEAAAPKRASEDDDNWDLPEEDIPY